MGAVVTTGISAYENRQGLARGDAKAIGNVVPVAGTLVGGAMGLAVGVGVAYGAQVSGARDWVADKAAKLVDGFKSWF